MTDYRNDPKIEYHLNEGQYRWELVRDVPFADIDMKASRENPARTRRKLNEAARDQYCLAMIDGVPFPPIVLLRLDPGSAFKYIVATGMHRISAAEKVERDCFDAYIVTEPDQYRREALILQLNNWEGQATPIIDQIANLLDVHEKNPSRSLSELAREWYLDKDKVLIAWKEQRSHRRAHQFGYDFVRARTHQKSVLALNRIHSDRVFERATAFVTQHGPQAAQVELMVKEINKTRDEAGQLEIVDGHIRAEIDQHMHAKAKHGRISPVAATRLISTCRSANNQIDRGIEALHLSALATPDTAIIVCEELIRSLKRVVVELERIQRVKEQTMALVSSSTQPQQEARH